TGGAEDEAVDARLVAGEIAAASLGEVAEPDVAAGAAYGDFSAIGGECQALRRAEAGHGEGGVARVQPQAVAGGGGDDERVGGDGERGDLGAERMGVVEAPVGELPLPHRAVAARRQELPRGEGDVGDRALVAAEELALAARDVPE